MSAEGYELPNGEHVHREDLIDRLIAAVATTAAVAVANAKTVAYLEREKAQTHRGAHPTCPPEILCPCSSEMGDRLLRDLLYALGWDVPARSDAPGIVWDEALQRVRDLAGPRAHTAPEAAS